jgi:hypothetical protein
MNEDRVRDLVNYKQTFFDRDGKAITLEEMCIITNKDPSYKIVKQEIIDDYLVSTVWIGIDMNFFASDKPLIFETMIFDETSNKRDSRALEYQERYATEEEAFIGHEEAVAYIRSM